MGRLTVRNDEEFQLRRFRVAIAVVMTWPWVVGFGYLVLTDRPHVTLWLWLIPLAIDALLLGLSLRKPWGVAPILVLVRYGFVVLTYVFHPGEIRWWWDLIQAVEFVVLLVLLLPIWRNIRDHRRRLRREQHARLDRAYAEGDRRSSSRRTDRELRRAGFD